MRFAVFCVDPVHQPWVIPVDGTRADAMAAAMSTYSEEELVHPIMVIDYKDGKTWRVGRDEEGWYLSDSAAVKMGYLTELEHITRDVAPVEASCES